MSEFLITPSLGTAVVTSQEAARTARDGLLVQAATVVAIKDRIDADDATSVLRNLKSFLTTIETARTEAKAPALDIGRKIDALAKELVAKVDSEYGRISRVVGAFETEERRKAEVARQKAEAEAAEIKAEADRKAREALRSAPTEEAGVRAADKIVEQSQQAITSVRQMAAEAVAPRNAGTSVREDVVFEIHDIKALYAAHPELVILEPNNSAIRAILRANPNLKVPGLTHRREAKLNVR